MTDAAGPLGWINYWKPKDEWHYVPAERRAALLAAWAWNVSEMPQALPHHQPEVGNGE